MGLVTMFFDQLSVFGVVLVGGILLFLSWSRLRYGNKSLGKRFPPSPPVNTLTGHRLPAERYVLFRALPSTTFNIPTHLSQPLSNDYVLDRTIWSAHIAQIRCISLRRHRASPGECVSCMRHVALTRQGPRPPWTSRRNKEVHWSIDPGMWLVASCWLVGYGCSSHLPASG